MKIEKIAFKNITSYEGEHEVDFTQEPLRSAGLFAICGDTGAGKSTLLDVVCLALYSNAPRLDGAQRIDGKLISKSNEDPQGLQPNDARNFMRRSKDSSYAQVVFTMPDGCRYEATWSCKLNRNNKYREPEHEFRQLYPKKQNFNGKKSDIRKEIIRVVGLTFDQFCRTVLLAQNSFAAFLKAENKEKSDLLEKLTGTEIYARVSSIIFERNNQSKAKLAELQSKIEGLLHDRLTPEQLEETQNNIRIRETRFKDIVQRQERVYEKKRWLVTFKESFKELEASNQEKEVAHRELVSRGEWKNKLDRHDSVLEVQSLFENIMLRESDLKRIQLQMTRNEESFQQINRDIKNTENLLNKSKELHKNNEDRYTQNLPIIRKGHQLEGEIVQAEKLLSEQLEEYRNICAESEKRYNEWQVVQKQKKNKEEEFSNKKQQRQVLQADSKMYDQIEAVNYKLSDFKKLRETISEEEQKKQQAQEERKKWKEKFDAINKELTEKKQKLQWLEGEMELHRRANYGKDGVELQKMVMENKRREADLLSAEELWQRISDNFEYFKELSARVSRNTTYLLQLEKERNASLHLYESSKVAYDMAHDNYMRAQSQDVKRLRRELKEGSPCPVCGATHHPYHTETEIENGQLVSELEKTWKAKKEELDSNKEVFENKKGEYIRENERLSYDSDELKKLNEILERDQTIWERFASLDSSLKDCSMNIDAQRRMTTIRLLHENAQKQYKFYEHELDEYNKHQQSIETLSRGIEELHNSISQLNTSCLQCSNTVNIRTNEIELYQSNSLRNNRSLKEVYNDLNGIITIENWMAEWEKYPDIFSKQINANSENWRNINVVIDKLEREIDGLNNIEDKVYSDYQKTRSDSNIVQNKCKTLQELLYSKREELKKYFGQQSVESVEAQMRENINATRQKVEEQQLIYDKYINHYNEITGILKNLKKGLEETQQELSEKNKKLDTWLHSFNASHPPIQRQELAMLLSNKEDWNAIRQELDACRRRVELAQQRNQTAERRYNELHVIGMKYGDISEITEENIGKEEEELQAHHQLISAELNDLRRCIQGHENSLRNAAKEEKNLLEVQEDAQQWAKLNELFGSSDGKKFRDIAQQYTFRFLVEHSNAQLALFSPRYRLDTIPGTLAIKVIDRDMYDEQHYATSLSGGETFIVSLALALGLASLSSTELTIGSLFIDEGFGNLDKDSLDVVMQALSNLESSQGRKVGVISHTDQIKEQIYPQIRVQKIPGEARSVIKIV